LKHVAKTNEQLSSQRQIKTLYTQTNNRLLCFHQIQGENMNHNMTTTSFEMPGYTISKNLGIVRGITVRSRSIVGNIGAGLQSIFGGNITIFTKLCEEAREEAFQMMGQHAEQLGGNAVIGVRYDATEIMEGISEVLCYGTAVVITPKG